MNTPLKHIKNWTELAKESNWSARKLAKVCGVSLRTLQRHFLANVGVSPKAWLAEQRQRQAAELLRKGASVKETSIELGYKQPTNFTRKYKSHWGVCPSLIQASQPQIH
ncbi:MAG TPA: helix-turn-helix transcriptional regulator [Verrucomicrobiae bacterium]|nr:helix-turn-helix transcriptional regulator [Verrucomicrobiae bacterium]